VRVRICEEWKPERREGTENFGAKKKGGSIYISKGFAPAFFGGGSKSTNGAPFNWS
jgi:hypothetical protein